MSHSVVSLTKHISRCTKDVMMMEYKTEESNELKRKEVESNKESINKNVERFMTFDSDLDIENEQETAAYNNMLIKEDLDIKLFIGKEICVTKKIEKLQKDIQSVNGTAGFVPVMSSTSVGDNIDPHGSEFEHEVQQKNLEEKIDTGRNVAMKHKWLKLQKANQCVKIAAGLLPEVSSASLDDDIDPSASEHEHELDRKNLEMMNLRARNVPIKHKLFQLRKAHEWLKVAAALLPAESSASLGENIEPCSSEFEHELHEQNLQEKIETGRNVAMKHKLLNLKKATQLLNSADNLEPAMPISNFLGDKIDHSASQYKNQLEQENIKMKILWGGNVDMKNKLLQLQKAHEWLKAADALLPAESSASLCENINPHASEHKREFQQQNLEMKIETQRNEAMKHKWLKLQKANQCLKIAAGLLTQLSSASLDDSTGPSASEYEHELDQKNLQVMNLRARNVPIKHKLIQLQKAHEWLKAAAALLEEESSASLGKNIDPHGSEFEHELHQKNLEVKVDTGGNIPMNHKWLKLQKANQCVKIAAGLLPEVSSASLDDGIHHSALEYEHELDLKNLEVMNLRGRYVPIKHKLIQLRKAHEWLKAAAALLPAKSSPSLGNNINTLGSKFEHVLHQKNLEVKIDTGGKVPMKHKWLKLQKANQCVKIAAGLLPEVSLASLDDGIDPSASEYEHELDQKNLEVMNLRARNVLIKHKLIQLQKAHEWLKAAAALLPAVSSASLGEHINLCGSEFEHELQQQNLEAKIEKGKNVPKKYKLLNLKKATQLLNSADDLEPAMSILTFLGDSIDHSASQFKNQLEQNLKMKIMQGGNVAMKYQLLQLRKAHEWLKAANALLAAESSESLWKNINPHSSECELELQKQNLEVKTDTERNIAKKQKWLELQKANQYVKIAADLLSEVSSASLDDGIHHSAPEYEHKLDQKNLEVMNLRARYVPIKHKLIQLQNAHEWLKAAAALLPAMSSASLGKNISPLGSESEHELHQKNLEAKTDTGRNVPMKHKWLKLQKANQCVKIAAGLLSEVSSASLDDGIHHSASEYEHELDMKNLEVMNLRVRNVPMKHKLWELQKAHQCLNIAAGLLPEVSSASLNDGIEISASAYEHELDKKNPKVMNLRARNVPIKHKLIQLRKAHEWLQAAAALLPAMSSPSLGNNINPLGSKFEHELHEKNLKVKIDTGGKVPMKHKLFQLRKAHEWLKAAAALLPAVSSASLGEHTNIRGSEFEHELHQQNLEAKIKTGRNGAKKYKLLNLKKATQLLNSADDLEPAMPISTSLGDNINHSAPQYKNQLEQQNLEMKILRGKNVAMKDKLLQLQNNIQYLNAAQGFLPAKSSGPLDKNIDLNSSGRKHEVEQKNLEMKILRERHTAMKRKLLMLCNANQSINVPGGLVPAMPALTSLGDNVDPNASEYEHQLELKDMDHRTSSTYQHLQNRMTCWI